MAKSRLHCLLSILNLVLGFVFVLIFEFIVVDVFIAYRLIERAINIGAIIQNIVGTSESGYCTEKLTNAHFVNRPRGNTGHKDVTSVVDV